MKWLIAAVIVVATVGSDLLQSYAMKRHGEIREIGPGLFARLARNRLVIAAYFLMAVSFFAFMQLTQHAGLSFAVPATAATYVVETVLARFLLRERISAPRWAGAVMVGCGVAMLAL